jgi:hypothetical protein
VWTFVAEEASSGGTNIYGLLCVVATAMAGLATTVLLRQRRSDTTQPEPDPEPVARKVAEGLDTYLKQQVRQLQKQLEAKDLELDEERERRGRLEVTVATLRAEQSDLRYRLAQRGGHGD